MLRRPPRATLDRSSAASDVYKRQTQSSIYESIVNGAPAKDVIQTTDNPNLDILPGSIDLVGAEIEMIDMEEREHRMKKVLDPLRELYDFIIIDCSPSLGLVTVNALVAADSVIVPVQLSLIHI